MILINDILFYLVFLLILWGVFKYIYAWAIVYSEIKSFSFGQKILLAVVPFYWLFVIDQMNRKQEFKKHFFLAFCYMSIAAIIILIYKLFKINDYIE